MVLWLTEQTDLSRVEAQFALSLALLLVLGIVRVLVVRVITRRVDDTVVWYRTRKSATYTLGAVAVFGLIGLWFGALRELGTFLGLVGAGIAIALSDVLRNLAGWLHVVIRRPYHVDDRVQIGDVAGDVIDIRVFRTTLLEMGNWVDADQSTGRIVHVPNGRVLSEPVYNATEMGYLWHEIVVPVTVDSDWRRAEQRLQAALEHAAGHTAEEAAIRIRRASRSYKIRYTHLTPTVYVSVRDGNVRLTGRILVDARRRRAIDQQVWRAVLQAVADDPSIVLAFPTQRTVLREPLRVDAPAPGQPSPGRSPDRSSE